MDRATKRVRFHSANEDPARLTPSQVQAGRSNIFGQLQDEAELSEDDIDGDNGDGAEDEDENTDRELNDEQDIEAEDVSSIDGIETDQLVTGVDRDVSADRNDGDDPVRRRGRDSEAESAAFGLALDKILGRDLPKSAKKDPVLARSLASRQVDAEREDAKLERKARAQMAAEKKIRLDRNHDNLERFYSSNTIDSDDDARALERERNLRKLAQRGVIRLFNAIKQAQTDMNRQHSEQISAARQRKLQADAVHSQAESKDGGEAVNDANKLLLDMIVGGGR
ncbi:pre-60S ribosomal particles component [Savitreella phatthalungensis]